MMEKENYSAIIFKLQPVLGKQRSVLDSKFNSISTGNL